MCGHEGNMMHDTLPLWPHRSLEPPSLFPLLLFLVKKILGSRIFSRANHPRTDLYTNKDSDLGGRAWGGRGSVREQEDAGMAAAESK